jgi:hypothetical protein
MYQLPQIDLAAGTLATYPVARPTFHNTKEGVQHQRLEMENTSLTRRR